MPEDIAAEVTPVIPLVKPHLIDMPVADPTALDRAADLVLREVSRAVGSGLSLLTVT